MNDPDTAAPEVGAELPGLHVSKAPDGRGVVRLVARNRDPIVQVFPTTEEAHRALRSGSGRELNRLVSMLSSARLEALMAAISAETSNVIPFRPRSPDLNSLRVS